MYLLPLPHLTHRYQSASAHHSVRSTIPSLFLSMKLHFSFSLGLSSSQSFHSSTKQWKLAAYSKATYTSSLSLLLHSFSCRFCQKAFTHHCSCFSQLISPSVTNLSNCVIFSFSFFVRCAFTCSTSTKMPFFTSSCSSSQMFYPQVCISGSWLNTLFLTFSQPTNFSLSTWTLTGPHTFRRRYKKAVSSAVLMVR